MELKLTNDELVFICVTLREQVRRFRAMRIEPHDTLAMLEVIKSQFPNMELANDPAVETVYPV